jgi:mRNA-degrading endonuclease toxin of MazEF toxin-antitoxin module
VPGLLQRGTIILADLDDYNGKISPHFAIILTSTAEIEAGADLFVVGISTSFTRPLPSHWFEMESHPNGDCTTKLRRPCVAKADWQNVIKASQIKVVRGRAKASTVKQILRYIQDNP